MDNCFVFCAIHLADVLLMTPDDLFAMGIQQPKQKPIQIRMASFFYLQLFLDF
jgi:hypothetical protein